MPLLRITTPSARTDQVVELLRTAEGATEITVLPGANRLTDGDLILAQVPRASIDDVLAQLPRPGGAPGLHVSVQDSEELYPPPAGDADDAIIWAQVTYDIRQTARLSWVNVALIVAAAGIAAVGIIEDQLLLVVGAMALSPDYYPIADTCLSLVARDVRHAVRGIRTLVVSFAAAIVGAWLLTEGLVSVDAVSVGEVPSHQLTLFISNPDALSVVVALIAGAAGAIAITLPGTRGIVGVFVSITTIPAAANMGVATVARDLSGVTGAAVQLGVNVASLLIAGAVTLALRRVLRR